jgi:hypothetical protein
VVSQRKLHELQDGHVKYLVGIMWLPTGWELGFNHFAGRLGIPMPETATLLSRHPVEFHTFHCEAALGLVLFQH